MSATPSTILVVEDDAIVRMLIVDVLEELEFNVLEADGSECALTYIGDAKQVIDLLMTDVVMPEINGRDLAKKLRSLQPLMRRLFMSGYTSDVIALHGILDDGTHFIQKPFTMKALSEKVRQALDRPT